jgi:hypothetical protein
LYMFIYNPKETISCHNFITFLHPIFQCVNPIIYYNLHSPLLPKWIVIGQDKRGRRSLIQNRCCTSLEDLKDVSANKFRATICPKQASSLYLLTSFRHSFRCLPSFIQVSSASAYAGSLYLSSF